DFNIPRFQKRPVVPSLEEVEKKASGRNEAIILAYETGAYSLREIGEYFGLHPSTVGVIVRRLRES
ncbi:MAG: addiction module toxin RelE, partial [Pseudomonadota bacterium]